MKLIKTEKEGLVRDVDSNAILSNDALSLQAYKTQRQRIMDLAELKTRFDEREKKLDIIESDLNEIKDALSILLKKATEENR